MAKFGRMTSESSHAIAGPKGFLSKEMVNASCAVRWRNPGRSQRTVRISYWTGLGLPSFGRVVGPVLLDSAVPLPAAGCVVVWAGLAGLSARWTWTTGSNRVPANAATQPPAGAIARHGPNTNSRS